MHQYRWVSNSLLTLTPVETVACCSPLSREPLSQVQAEHIAPLLKALADPVRLRLMSLVASHEGGEACVCDVTDAFELSQPTISHHSRCCMRPDCSNEQSEACGCTTAPGLKPWLGSPS